MADSKSITMKDVAREAGVALGTVSKVVNGIPVGRAYQRRVEDAIEKLGYHVNPQARALRSSRSNFVGVILPNLHNPFFSRLADCLCRELASRSHEMLLFLTESNFNLEQTYMLISEQQMVSGIICLTYNPELRIPKGIPTVSIDRSLGPGIACVASDNFGGGNLAAQKLMENGCRRLAFLRTGSPLPNETDKRRDGFIRACTDAGIPFHCECVDDGTPYSAFEDFLRDHLHEGRLDYDGLFCATDLLAYKIQRSLEQMGLRVPEDVQIIGYDGAQCFGDEDYYCSTIVQPVEEMARLCVDLVLQSRAPSIPCLLQIPVSYASGGSTRD
ncbi:MAG: LacI family DNA-binding transcriptional regulator [Clostridia bacterium]|nr:LacI family DNA-binding transcriptional regulator [Clostridia bacterium]